MTDAERQAAIDKLKVALNTTTEDAGLLEQIGYLLDAAMIDIGIAGVDGTNAVITDPLYFTAVTLFVKMRFGMFDDYDRTKAAYDEMKLQMRMNSKYTVWRRVNV